MDTGYVGYGGEETDFAWRLEAAGIPMAWVGGAVAYHQHHAVHIGFKFVILIKATNVVF